MSHPVRYRVARPLERFEPYAFLVGWAAIFTLPIGGLWTWAIAFSPDLALKIVRRVWRSRSPIIATPRREESAVVLEGTAGTVERLAFADVEALTSMAETGAPTDVRNRAQERSRARVRARRR